MSQISSFLKDLAVRLHPWNSETSFISQGQGGDYAISEFYFLDDPRNKKEALKNSDTRMSVITAITKIIEHWW